MKGFDDAARKLKKLSENASKMDGEQSVPIEELLTAEFMREQTPFDSIDAFLASEPLNVNSKEDFEALDQQKLDLFVGRNSAFTTWDEMLHAAGAKWVERQLYEGI
jgi:hypothetical protein